tara:strand:+ start:17909 stop:18091 length:183 start_codon:yes stop_codon:yes gene_type:complete
MSMIKINKSETDKSRSYRMTLFWLFHLELGFHFLNGYHINTGIGVGPMEVSMALHTWDKW